MPKFDSNPNPKSTTRLMIPIKEAVSGGIPGQPGTKIIIDLRLATKCAYNEIRNLAYLWEDNPVLEYLGAPIYANDEYKLPGAPWNYIIQ